MAAVMWSKNVIIQILQKLHYLISTLACARIGAVHSIVFGGYSAESLASRILDAKAKVLVTADGVWRGNKLIHLLGLYSVPHDKYFLVAKNIRKQFFFVWWKYCLIFKTTWCLCLLLQKNIKKTMEIYFLFPFLWKKKLWKKIIPIYMFLFFWVFLP